MSIMWYMTWLNLSSLLVVVIQYGPNDILLKSLIALNEIFLVSDKNWTLQCDELAHDVNSKTNQDGNSWRSANNCIIILFFNTRKMKKKKIFK